MCNKDLDKDALESHSPSDLDKEKANSSFILLHKYVKDNDFVEQDNIVLSIDNLPFTVKHFLSKQYGRRTSCKSAIYFYMYRTFFRRLVTQIYSGTVQIYKFQQLGNSIINPRPPPSPPPSHLPL